jgi:hypothetical protein
MIEESYLDKECFFVDRVTFNKKYDGHNLGKCIEESIHVVYETPIVCFETPFLGFTWQDKRSVRLKNTHRGDK